MVAQNVFHRASSHQIINLWRFAEGVTFHGTCPPFFFILTWLQQYSRGAFLYSAHCSLNNPICFWSVCCRRAMIPGKIFTSFAKFQGIVCVNDFKLPIRLPELLRASFGFMRSFCFARIQLDPLGSQVLHHDCISMIVSRFTSFTQLTSFCNSWILAVSSLIVSWFSINLLLDWSLFNSSISWRLFMRVSRRSRFCSDSSSWNSCWSRLDCHRMVNFQSPRINNSS